MIYRDTWLNHANFHEVTGLGKVTWNRMEPVLSPQRGDIFGATAQGCLKYPGVLVMAETYLLWLGFVHMLMLPTHAHARFLFDSYGQASHFFGGIRLCSLTCWPSQILSDEPISRN